MTDKITLKDIAHDVNRDDPSLGTKDQIETIVAKALDVIIERAARGQDVGLHKFGTFKAALFKGRTLKSPLMKTEGGEVTFPDQFVLRFHQAPAAKKAINELAAHRLGSKKKSKAEPEAEKPKKKAKAEPEAEKPAKKAKKKNKAKKAAE